MSYGNASNVSTTNLDAAGDSPAAARADLKAALDELINVINGLGVASGAAKIESTGVISAAVTGLGTTTGDLTLTPFTKMAKVQNFINLNPVNFANLPASPALGDIAFLTTDGAGATKNEPCFYNGSAWFFFGTTPEAVATS